jgi:hypothetical protein
MNLSILSNPMNGECFTFFKTLRISPPKLKLKWVKVEIINFD